MSGMSRAPVRAVPKAIINYASAGGKALEIQTAAPTVYFTFCNVVTSGAITANTLATLLNVSGPGEVSFLRVLTTDATIRTMRVRLTLDGVVVFDATSAASTGGQGECMTLLGSVMLGTVTTGPNGTWNGYPMVGYDKVQFNKSMLLEVCSNITETGKLAAALTYRTF